MIRAATPADIPAMRALEANAATAAHWSTEEYLRLFSGSPRRLALVVEDGSIQGFMVGKQIGPEWEIENIAVAEGARWRGFGSRLLSSFLDLIRELNAESVFLEVRESNVAARALYRKHGFVETGRRPAYYGHPVEDAVLYGKIVGSR